MIKTFANAFLCLCGVDISIKKKDYRIIILLLMEKRMTRTKIHKSRYKAARYERTLRLV